jgi:hypothetical protein
MRSYSINLSGRVKNFPLSKNTPLVPLYEAISNSLHAIEERRKSDSSFSRGEIVIRIIRDKQRSLENTELQSAIESFEITDNGIGFNKNNMNSFLESDSTYKADRGGKGVGRFSWLKAFSCVDISSVFCEKGVYRKRHFIFSLDTPKSIKDSLIEADTHECETVVRLDTYKPEYKKEVPKQIDTIAMRVMQHFLVYFLDDKCPEIILEDTRNSIVLNQLFKEKIKHEDNDEIIIKSHSFNLLSIKIEDKSFSSRNHLYLCANNRLVINKDLEPHIADLDGQLFERYGFWYVGVLTSPYLDGHVDMSRLSFDIPESDVTLFNEITLEEIIDASCIKIKEYLNKYLTPIAAEKIEYIKHYVTNTAPQYRHLLKYMPERISRIKPKLSEDKLDDELHTIKQVFDKESKKEQQRLLKEIEKTSMNADDYERYFRQQIEKITDANRASLSEYVVHRRIIIELLEKGLRQQDDGKFNKESYVHNLIYPMRATSEETNYESHNLWLIDEKFSYCTFISSDMYFNNDPKQERADILLLNNPIAVSDSSNDGTIFDTIIIFELKRPMRDDYTDGNNPISQLNSYVRKIRNNEAKDKYHRAINVNASTKYYLYAVCDITPKLIPFLEDNSFTKTPDGIGYYNFNRTYNAYFEILSYDKIVADAKKRNRVLFDKLGLIS